LVIINLCVSLLLCSPFLFVLGDDRVTCYTWADDITGDVVDA